MKKKPTPPAPHFSSKNDVKQYVFLCAGALVELKNPGWRAEVYLLKSLCVFLSLWQSGKRQTFGIVLIWVPVPSLSTLAHLLCWPSVSSSFRKTHNLVELLFIKSKCCVLQMSSFLSHQSIQLCQLPFGTHWLIACFQGSECDSSLPSPCAFHTVGSQQCFSAWLVFPGKAVAKWCPPRTKGLRHSWLPTEAWLFPGRFFDSCPLI